MAGESFLRDPGGRDSDTIHHASFYAREIQMSNAEPLKSGNRKEVSKARKIVSAIILVGLLVVLGIEGRAGFGHSSAAKALQDLAPDGAFETGAVTEEQIDNLMTLSPTKEELEGGTGSGSVVVEYKYSWKSLVRPLMSNMPPTDLYVTFSKEEPRHALLFGTEAPDPRKPAAATPAIPAADGDVAGMGGGGGEGRGGRGMGQGGDAPVMGTADEEGDVISTFSADPKPTKEEAAEPDATKPDATEEAAAGEAQSTPPKGDEGGSPNPVGGSGTPRG